MKTNKALPYLVSGFIASVGLFFIIAGYIGPNYLQLRAPGRHYLLGLSILFIFIGFLMTYLARRGVLKKVGITTEDVRRETISKMSDKQLLAKVALEDESERIRATAADRLKELSE